MNTFLDFLSDNTFFTIFSGVIVALVLAFIITLVKGQKADKKPIEDVSEENYLNSQVESGSPLDVMDNSLPSASEFENNLMGSNSPDTGYQAAFTNYIPDLTDSDSSNDTKKTITEQNNVDVPFKEPILPSALEVENPLVPSSDEIPDVNVLEQQIVKEDNLASSEPEISEAKKIEDDIIPDFSAKEEPAAIEPINETAKSDEIEMPLPITETPELAFASLPSDDKTINEDIKIETEEDYDLEKTEIFDFPDFSKAEINDDKVLVDVEKVVMDAANKYIESVMKS